MNNNVQNLCSTIMGADKGVVEGAQALVDMWSGNIMGR